MRSSTVAILAALLITSAAAAAPAKGKRPVAKPKPRAVRVTGIPRYTLTYTMNNYAGRMEFIGKIISTQTGAVIATPSFSFTDKLQVSGASGAFQWILDVMAEGRSSGRAVLRISTNGAEIERTFYSLVTKSGIPLNAVFRGDPISITFRNAKLADVLTTFTKLTGIQFIVDPGVDGTINKNFQNVAWDAALDDVITTAGYQSKYEGRKLHIYPQ